MPDFRLMAGSVFGLHGMISRVRKGRCDQKKLDCGNLSPVFKFDKWHVLQAKVAKTLDLLLQKKCGEG